MIPQFRSRRRAPAGPGTAWGSVVALLAMLLALPVAAAGPRQGAMPRPVGATVPRAAAIRFDPAMTLARLRALPPDTRITLRSGRTVSAAQLAATSEALKMLGARQRQLQAMDLRMSRPAGAPQVQWNGPRQFTQVDRLPAGAVVRLQDGRLLTAGDIAKLQALAARTDLPRKLEARAAARAANLRGKPAMVVRNADDLRKVERLPDNAIVATEDGKRATAGDIRKVMARRARPALRQPGAK